MDPIRHETEGGKAVAEGGLVLLDGPDGCAVAMTAEAARHTAHELLAAADSADAQSADGAGA